MTAPDPRTVFASAAQYFVALTKQIPADGWDGPGLGEWSVRDLVGHTSRSLVTVSTYLGATTTREDLTSDAHYYEAVRDFATQLGAADIVERGRRAGRDLGAEPASAVEALAAAALADIDAVDDPLIEVIGGYGIRLSHYLPTRTFELAVHGMDIARAVGLDTVAPDDVLADAAALAARIAVRLGQGPAALLALTGRAPLPPGFSVV